jgi:predicted nucleotidyltransferase/DNA-binding XRE family transcriptional regulator
MNAGLSQVELARRAGVTQSVVSAYESGRRQPSLPMLARLVEAAGCQLEMTVRPVGPQRRRLGGVLGHRLRSHRDELRKIAARYGVVNVRVFGSVARGEDTADSDIDLLVDLPPGASLFTVARLQRDLEAVLGSRVEIVPAGDLKPRVAQNVEQDLVPL